MYIEKETYTNRWLHLVPGPNLIPGPHLVPGLNLVPGPTLFPGPLRSQPLSLPRCIPGPTSTCYQETQVNHSTFM